MMDDFYDDYTQYVELCADMLDWLREHAPPYLVIKCQHEFKERLDKFKEDYEYLQRIKNDEN